MMATAAAVMMMLMVDGDEWCVDVSERERSE